MSRPNNDKELKYNIELVIFYRFSTQLVILSFSWQSLSNNKVYVTPFHPGYKGTTCSVKRLNDFTLSVALRPWVKALNHSNDL